MDIRPHAPHTIKLTEMLPNCDKTPVGVMKIPEPIIVPKIIRTPSNKPMTLLSFNSCTLLTLVEASFDELIPLKFD